MKSNLMNNYRMGGYLLIALGLINLRYQSGQNSVLQHSLTIIVPGVLVLASTGVPVAAKKLESKAIQWLSLVIGGLLIAYAVIN